MAETEGREPIAIAKHSCERSGLDVLRDAVHQHDVETVQASPRTSEGRDRVYRAWDDLKAAEELGAYLSFNPDDLHFLDEIAHWDTPGPNNATPTITVLFKLLGPTGAYQSATEAMRKARELRALRDSSIRILSTTLRQADALTVEGEGVHRIGMGRVSEQLIQELKWGCSIRTFRSGIESLRGCVARLAERLERVKKGDASVETPSMPTQKAEAEGTASRSA